MSELKNQLMLNKEMSWVPCYLKSEADKVIADLYESHKMEVEQLLIEIAERKEKYKELAKLHDKAIQACCDADKVIAHYKYKRCLAMEKWCDAEADVAYADGDYEDMRWYQKWHQKWLELAEKFKPNNSTAQSGKVKQTMINAQENANADMPMSKCIRDIPRTNSDVICELAIESRELSWRLDKLKNAIAADPEAVSAHHKELWRKQAKAMQEYVDVLGERIKDLIDNG